MLKQSNILPFDKLPLEFIFKQLNAHGFELSVADILEIQSIVLTRNINEDDWDLQDLKYIIAPFIAQDEFQQNYIYSIIDRSLKLQKQIPLTNVDLNKSNHFQTFVANFFKDLKYSIWNKFFLTIFLSIIAAAFFVYMGSNALLAKYIEPSINQDINKKGHFGFELPLNMGTKVFKINSTTENKKSKTPKKPIQETAFNNDVKIIYDNSAFAITKKELIKPTVPNVIIPITVILGLLFGVALHFIVFYKQKKLQAFDVESSKEKEIEAKDSNNNQLDVFKELDKTSSTIIFKFNKLELVLQKLSNLKIWVDDKKDINVSKTINKTVENNGYPQLIFNENKNQESFLLFIQKNEDQDYVNRSLDILINLIEKRLNTTIYYYNNSIEFVRKKGFSPTEFFHETLLNTRAKKIIIIGKKESLQDVFLWNNKVERQSFLTKNIYETFSSFSTKIFINTNTSNDNNELYLRWFDFVETPFSAKNITTVLQNIGTNVSYKKANSISIENKNSNDTESLKNYFKNDNVGFQVVCALAVYPSIKWLLFQNIYKNILEKNNGFNSKNNESEFDLFYKICNLNWLKEDAIINSKLRLNLLEHLDAEIEIITRKTIVDSLTQYSVYNSLDSFNATQLKINQGFLYAINKAEFSHYKNEYSTLKTTLKNNDEILTNHLQNIESKTVVQSTKHIDVLSISFARVVILLIPACLIYLYLINLQPSFAFPKGNDFLEPVEIELKAINNAQLKVYKDKFDFESIDKNTPVLHINKSPNDSVVVGFTLKNNDKIEYRTSVPTSHKIIEIETLR